VSTPDHPPPAAGPPLRWLAGATLAVAVRPALWGTAVRQTLVLAVTGWWRRPPFLPLPDPVYLRFRLQTAYGDPERPPRPADVVTYLHWCRAWPRVAGG
jgi:hypothetical protein